MKNAKDSKSNNSNNGNDDKNKIVSINNCDRSYN